MTTNKRRYWGIVPGNLPAAAVTAQAKMQEDAGLDGLFAVQVYGTPFVPLAAAATATSRIRLASGIALAFVRSPFETALHAMDLDRISGGRFTLGLGCSVRAWSEGMYGMPYGKPLEHMREVRSSAWSSARVTPESLRATTASIISTTSADCSGHRRRRPCGSISPSGSPPPPLRTDIPIWIAALRGPLVSLAAEIADGVMGHPIWSIPWAAKKIPDALERA